MIEFINGVLKGGCTVDKDFQDFIVARCDTALKNSEEYSSLKSREHDPEEEEDTRERAIYGQGFIDGMMLAFRCSQKM